MKLKHFTPGVLAILLLVLTLTLAACGSDGQVPEGVSLPDEPLRILEWTGYEATEYPYLYPAFTEKYTGTLDSVLEYTFFAEDAEAIAKMQTGFEVDLVHPCEAWFGLYVEYGLLQPLDTSRLTYWDQLNPRLTELGYIDGEYYIVPWDWGFESILVRSDLVEEMPDSWADLWDPQYAGHVMLWDSGQANYAITALALGIADPWGELSAENVERVEQKLIELKPNLLTYWSDFTQAYDMPASGEAWLTANAWQDAYGYLDTEGYQVEFIDPAEGRVGWACGFGISKDAQNLDLVYEFLNAASAPESTAALANEYWYGGGNVTALPLIDEYIVDVMGLDRIDEFFDETIFYQPLDEAQRRMITEMWDAVKAAP